MINFVITIFFGAFISWAIARHYYNCAGRDLAEEAKKLRKLNTLIIKGLEEAGLAEFNRDSSGEPCGLIMKFAARGEINSSGNAVLSIDDEDASKKN